MEKEQVSSRKFFDRQMQIFGAEGQKAISKSWVFVQNIGGVHAELIKNLALLGFNIVLKDGSPLEEKDFKVNLFFNANSINLQGQRKDHLVCAAVRELNPLISVITPENAEEEQLLLKKCGLFLAYPRSYDEFEECRRGLANFDGIKFYTFCEFASGLSFIESRTTNQTKTIPLLDTKEAICQGLKPQMLEDFFNHFIQNGPFNYNDEARTWFTFSGIYGSLLSQILLNCILEGPPSFNLVNYEVFGKETNSTDACSLITTSI